MPVSTIVRSDMFLVTYTMTYEEVNALEACRTSRDMLRVTYAWCSSRGGGVAYIKRLGGSSGGERNFQLSEVDHLCFSASLL